MEENSTKEKRWLVLINLSENILPSNGDIIIDKHELVEFWG